MNKQTKKQTQTNILYDYYRFCNEQENCRECPLCFIVENIYGYYEALYNQSKGLTEEENDLLYDEIYEEFTKILKDNKYRCLKDFNKEELEYAIKKIEEWCKINPELQLKDVDIIGYINNTPDVYPRHCPHYYGILNEYNYLNNKTKKCMEDFELPNQLIHSVNCNKKEKVYDENCEECKACWDIPLRYEEGKN